MKVDLPEFKKCCCCVPLRPGLLVIGYLKLLTSLLVVGFLIFVSVSVAYKMFSRILYVEILLIIFCILLMLLEISLTVVFLVGAHKKNHNLLKIYYFYSIVVLCLYMIFFLLSIVLELVVPLPIVMDLDSPAGFYYMQSKITSGLFNALIQLYVILLIRSEVNKLQNNSKFIYSKEAANEAQCHMETDDVQYKNNINTQLNKDAREFKAVDEKEGYDNKNINIDSDDRMHLNKYIKIKNEE